MTAIICLTEMKTVNSVNIRSILKNKKRLFSGSVNQFYCCLKIRQARQTDSQR